MALCSSVMAEARFIMITLKSCEQYDLQNDKEAVHRAFLSVEVGSASLIPLKAAEQRDNC